MTSGIFLLVVGVLPYVCSGPAHSALVWLKDVTSHVQTDKRTLSNSNLDLPDKIFFNLITGSHVVVLNLKRNHGIDPNADIYFVLAWKDGRSDLEKAMNSEKEDVAYYLDKENWAFMTVRCIKKSNGQCERVINGNIRIGDRNYDLRPLESDATSINLLAVSNLVGRRYVLHEQTNIQRDLSVENKDTANDNEKNDVDNKLADLLRRNPHPQNNHFLFANYTLTSRNVARNNSQKFYVEIAVLIDSGIWDLYSSVYIYPNTVQKEMIIIRKIRETYCHIINGVNMLYNNIHDTSMEISVTLRKFYIFKHNFQHIQSIVKMVDGIKLINAQKYIFDITKWDINLDSTKGTDYDHAMLFTRYDLYVNNTVNRYITGLSYTGKVCSVGGRVSVVEVHDFFLTTSTAAHELGHNLGAYHDSEMSAIACRAEDLFIMSPIVPQFSPTALYTRNPWLFSHCSVEAFKKTLPKKACLANEGLFDDEQEWKHHVQKLPGEVYSPNQQCELIIGSKSKYCGNVLRSICRFMQCTDPNTGNCLLNYYSAASGTSCGVDLWCMEGRCTLKHLKSV